MFIPDMTLVNITYDTDNLPEYLTVWSDKLNYEVELSVMDSCEFLDTFDIEATKDHPKPYDGSESQDQDWVMLKNKDGNPLHTFWADAALFVPMYDDGEPLFKSNGGFDIDVESITFDSYNGEDIVYSDSVDGIDTSWNIGIFEDKDTGKVRLFSAVESNDSTGEDKDGDETFSTVPQEKFEAIRQLFAKANFKVKVARLPRNN